MLDLSQDAGAPTVEDGPAGISTAATEHEARALSIFHGHLPAEEMLKRLIRHELRGRIALVSSFGAEAAVLLHMVARVDPLTPVIFIDTGKLFGETLAYRDTLIDQFGLRDVRSVRPEPARLRDLDPRGGLWRSNADRCCYLRKVEPLERALKGFDAWISGRKSFQSATRAGVPSIEADGGRIKVNPLASWRKADLDAYFRAHDLPRHPLEADGFLSIGCVPCTDRVKPGEDARMGRWRGREKTECGIHDRPAKFRPAAAG